MYICFSSTQIISLSQVTCTGTANGYLLICTPTNAQFTVFLGADSTPEAADESKKYLLSIIRDGMRNDRYISPDVNQVIFTSDQSPASINVKSDKHITDEESQTPKSTNHAGEQSSVPIFTIAAIITSLFVVIVIFYLVKQRKKRRNIAPSTSRRKSVVSFAQSLEEEIPNSCDSSCSSRSDHVDTDSKCVKKAVHSKDDIMDGSGADSDSILQWVFKKDKFISDF